jgi:hypothetical protein
MKDSDVVQMPDGTTLNKRQLYLEVIQMNPTGPGAYCDLADALKPNDTIKLRNGRVVSKLQLLLESMKYEQYSRTYCKIAQLLKTHEGWRNTQ